MRVKPAPDRKVRDPATKRHLPETGKNVPESSFWLRRLDAGDVILVPEVQIPDSKVED
jgi:hypothetical protein